jgi:hypothetical protein
MCACCAQTWLCACLECKHKKADLLPERDVAAASQVPWLAAVVAEGAGGTTPDVVPQHCVVCVWGRHCCVYTHVRVCRTQPSALGDVMCITPELEP